MFKPVPPTPKKSCRCRVTARTCCSSAPSFDPTLQEPDFRLVGLPTSVDGAYGIVQLRPDQLDRQGRSGARRRRLRRLPPRQRLHLPHHTRSPIALLALNPAVRWVGTLQDRLQDPPATSGPAPTVETTEITLRALPRLPPREACEQELAQRVPAAVAAADLRPRARETCATASPPPTGSSSSPLRPPSPAWPSSSPIAARSCTTTPRSARCSPTSPPAPSSPTPAPRRPTAASSTATSPAPVRSRGGRLRQRLRHVLLPQRRRGRRRSPTRRRRCRPATGAIDLTKKVAAYYVLPGATAYDNTATCPGGSPISFHGTHTSAPWWATTSSTSRRRRSPGIDTGDGMAPNAKLVFQDVGHDTTGCLVGPERPVRMSLQALDAGARVHSNSYGARDRRRVHRRRRHRRPLPLRARGDGDLLLGRQLAVRAPTPSAPPATPRTW